MCHFVDISIYFLQNNNDYPLLFAWALNRLTVCVSRTSKYYLISVFFIGRPSDNEPDNLQWTEDEEKKMNYSDPVKS